MASGFTFHKYTYIHVHIVLSEALHGKSQMLLHPSLNKYLRELDYSDKISSIDVMIQCGSVNTSYAARYKCGYRYKILLSQTKIKTEVFLTK